MKLPAVLFSLLFSSIVMAEHDAHKHHNLGAHEHGNVKLAFAIEGKSLDIDMDGPSESFLGFEHKPVSKDDQLAFNKANDLWTKEILTKLIMFPNNFNCRIDAANFHQNYEEESTGTKKSSLHSEIEATAKITCDGGSFKGSEVKIGLKDKFPKIKKLKLEILEEDKTKSLDIKKAIETIRL